MKQTILVVDDQADERDAMATLLHRHQYTVESATNGQEALQHLRRGAPLPAMVLLDLNMPVMDGWEFLVHVAQDDVLRNVPVVVVSGSPVVQDAPQVPSNVTFMAKPVQPHLILQVIADLLDHRVRARTPPGHDHAVASFDDRDTDRYLVGDHAPAPATWPPTSPPPAIG